MSSKSEKSYIQSSLLAEPPLRADGRALTDYRAIQLATGVVPSANGSARVDLGGTHVLAACKLDIEHGDGDDAAGGRIACAVSCSPSAYPHHTPAALDDMQHDLADVLTAALAHPALRPRNLALTLAHGANAHAAWTLCVDCLVLRDAGNVHDALFAAARAALWDTRVPVVRAVEYRDSQTTRDGDGEDGSGGGGGGPSGLDTRRAARAVDIVLEDHSSAGAVLEGRDRWPVCVTLNLISTRHFLDATPQEEAAVPLRMLLVVAHPGSHAPVLQTVRLLGSGELGVKEPGMLVKDGVRYARELARALDEKLQSGQAEMG